MSRATETEEPDMTDAASVDDLRTANRAVVEAFFASNLDRAKRRIALQ